MNIAQRNQAKIKARIAAGENVVAPTPDYNKISRAITGNIAANNKQKVLAKQEQQKQQQLDSKENKTLVEEYDIIKASLEADLITLKSQKTIEKKKAYKEHIIPNYLDYLQQYLESGHNHPNGILSQVVVWLFDTEMFDLAIQYADFAIKQGQKLPTRFKTPNFETFICDELADYGSRQLKEKQPAPVLEFAIGGLQSGWDVNPIPAAKVYAIAAKVADQQGELDKCHNYCQSALELNDKAGVKKLLKEVIGKLADEVDGKE